MGEGGFDDGFGQWVEAGGGEGGSESKGGYFGDFWGGGDGGDGGLALGEGAGFIDEEEFDASKFFEGGGVADEDAEAGGAGETAGGGDGGSEAEGAGAGGDEDGDGPIDCGSCRFSSEDPSDGGGESEEEDEWSEEGGDAIGEALEGRGILFGGVDETSELGDEGVCPGFFGEDEKSAP